MMTAVEYAHCVVDSGALKAKKQLTEKDKIQLDILQTMIYNYEHANPENARAALNILIEAKRKEQNEH